MMVSENAKTYSGMMFLAKAARTKAIVHMTQLRVEMVNCAAQEKFFLIIKNTLWGNTINTSFSLSVLSSNGIMNRRLNTVMAVLMFLKKNPRI